MTITIYCINILKYIIFLILVCMPQFFFIIYYNSIGEWLNKTFNIDGVRTLDIYLAIFPLTFSGLLAIINFMVNFIKEQNKLKWMKIDEINTLIKNYNNILLKLTTNYHALINELYTLVDSFKTLKSNPFFSAIIDQWEINIKYIIDLSNNEEHFRSYIRNILPEIIKIYKSNSCFDHHIEYLNNFDTLFNKYNTLTIKDRVFISNTNARLIFFTAFY